MVMKGLFALYLGEALFYEYSKAAEKAALLDSFAGNLTGNEVIPNNQFSIESIFQNNHKHVNQLPCETSGRLSIIFLTSSSSVRS